MANPTTNFGWVMPTSTDLVTDLPADFAVFGQAVDTSMADLKGGTTGQVLSKASNTDMDFTWVTDAAGDITGVTAGTGISGGGTSGTVTVTNSMATAITTAGDLIKGTGSGTFDRLGIGTTGQVLTVVSGAPAWAAAAGGASFAGVVCTNSANTSVSNASQTTLTWDTDYIDVGGYHSTATNTGRITIPTGKGGYYSVSFQLRFDASATGRRIGYLYKNGTTELWSTQVNGTATNETVLDGTYIVSLAAADYIECRTYQNSGGAINVLNPEPYSFFSATYLGA
jgi:hypothetical protein